MQAHYGLETLPESLTRSPAPAAGGGGARAGRRLVAWLNRSRVMPDGSPAFAANSSSASNAVHIGEESSRCPLEPGMPL